MPERGVPPVPGRRFLYQKEESTPLPEGGPLPLKERGTPSVQEVLLYQREESPYVHERAALLNQREESPPVTDRGIPPGPEEGLPLHQGEGPLLYQKESFPPVPERGDLLYQRKETRPEPEKGVPPLPKRKVSPLSEIGVSYVPGKGVLC